MLTVKESQVVEFLTSNTGLANAIAALSGVLVAFLAFMASIISLTVSVKALKGQQKHNILSVRPIPEITVADYENSLRIKVRNNGNGPLFIKGFKVIGSDSIKSSVIACMGALPNDRSWTHFATDLESRVVMPGQFLPLLELTELESESSFSECRDLCRSWLSGLECALTYSDLYATSFEDYKKSLSWFGRNIAS